MPNKQIKSKDRVAEHGEVFTNEREVNAMLDLVKQETERIESRFLEPACGNGNFLAEVLNRKLAICKQRYSSNQADYEKYSFLAVSSIYGVDIMEDNAQECRDRLYSIWETAYKKIFKTPYHEQIFDTIHFVLKKNILCGNALTLKQYDDSPITFAQWDFTIGSLVKRKDYQLSELLDGQSKHKGDREQVGFDLFGDGDPVDDKSDWVYDEETKGYIPGPIKEYPPVDYWRIQGVK